MFDVNLPDFPFPVYYDTDDGSPMYGDPVIPYKRTVLFSNTHKVHGNGFDHLHRDEIEFLSNGTATYTLQLQCEVSVEFIYLLGRGI